MKLKDVSDNSSNNLNASLGGGYKSPLWSIDGDIKYG
jgi:hypothetical protein